MRFLPTSDRQVSHIRKPYRIKHPVSLIADGERIRRMLLNVVSNTIKYIPKERVSIYIKDQCKTSMFINCPSIYFMQEFALEREFNYLCLTNIPREKTRTIVDMKIVNSRFPSINSGPYDGNRHFSR